MTTKIYNRDSPSYGMHKICEKCDAQVGEGCRNERGVRTVSHSVRTYIPESER